MAGMMIALRWDGMGRASRGNNCLTVQGRL
ncbi:MAG: hypothetical protein BWX73_03343 [Lentisphaerae bacterium ADurb.Bin082]|nr:MAG: hypothetical protein BWX73_03343 [Lentisphaerae bacterium ADurb.Bin082]